jgi:hypothetical protein
MTFVIFDFRRSSEGNTDSDEGIPYLNLGGSSLDYPLAISPDLKIDAWEFAAAWNQDSESSTIALARTTAATKESYPFVSPDMIDQGMLILATVAANLALNVIAGMVKDRIDEILAAKAGSDAAPSVQVVVIQTKGKPVIVVKTKS